MSTQAMRAHARLCIWAHLTVTGTTHGALVRCNTCGDAWFDREIPVDGVTDARGAA